MIRVRNRSWVWWTSWSTVAVALLAIGLTGNHFIWRYHIKRFQVVRPGMFYRVAQPSEYGVHYLVRKQGVKTLISLQLFRPTLKKGLYDPGTPDGREERLYAQQLGANFLEWPQGTEACWPWPTPWMFEQFFTLMDEPKNWPIAVHCSGGRHRTGTLGALFRMEYDRWPADAALAEMYSFQFGLPLSVHEHNLRTYLPRPHPDQTTWEKLLVYWQPQLQNAGKLHDYEQLVHAVRHAKTEPGVLKALEEYVRGDQPFAMCLAQRVIDSPSDPLASLATERASACLAKAEAEAAEWSMAASLVADFGTPDQQAGLLKLLEEEPHTGAPSPRYHAAVLGVTNRYTRNRIPYLQPLLADPRPRLDPATARYHYCDTAMARLSVIINTNLMEHGPTPAGMTNWQYACQLAQQWMREHEEQTQLCQLVPPDGNNQVMIGDLPQDEDLSRMRK